MSTLNNTVNNTNEAAVPEIKILHNAQNLVKSGGATIAVHLTPETRSSWGGDLARLIAGAPQVKAKFKGGETAWQAAYDIGVQPIEQARTYVNANNKQFTYGAIVVQKKELAAAIVATMQATLLHTRAART
jgi:hypothetical protein